MKLAILGTRGIPAHYGGFETFAEKLAIGLTQLGHEVTVYCEAGTSPLPAEFHGVRLRYIASPRLGPLETILYDLKCLWDARSGYDVVYMLGYGAAFFCATPRLFGAEVWINPDGLEWARSKWNPAGRAYLRLMEWIAARVADRLIADAAAIRESLATRHGHLPSCTVIHYGCEIVDALPPIEPLAEWGLVPESYYLVVCRLEPENHIREILHAFQQSQSARELIVVGDHRAPTRYVRALGSIRDPRIRMIGTVYDQKKLLSLRAHAFAYMHGHSVGGTNPSLLEAMGCGNLIFAHDNPFNRENLGDGGLFFKTPEELTQSIHRMERDETGRQERRKAVAARARANYRWADVISNYAELLEQREVRQVA